MVDRSTESVADPTYTDTDAPNLDGGVYEHLEGKGAQLHRNSTTRLSRDWRSWVSPLLFMMTLIVNYASATGWIFPKTQAEVSAFYPNLVQPAPFTFSIWLVIYTLMLLPLISEYVPLLDEDTRALYKNRIRLFHWLWMIVNIGWNVAWSYEQLTVAMLCIIAYGFILALITDKVSKIEHKNRTFLCLTCPFSVHFGWVLVAMVANLTTLLVSVGLDGIGTTGAMWAIIALIAALAMAMFFYRSQGTLIVVLPVLWALIGVIAQQSPTSQYTYANTFVFIGGIVLFVGGIIVITILEVSRYNKKRHQQPAE